MDHLVGSIAAMGPEKWVAVEGIRTRYFEGGQGEPLLLLHGGNFGDPNNIGMAENWSLNWPGFASRFRVIAVDKIGQGFTDNPTRDDYTADAVVRHTQGFMAAIGLDRCHIVGHSRAGYLAARLTMEHQEQALSLTIVDSGSLSTTENTAFFQRLAQAPKPLLTRESIDWVTEAFSAGRSLITDDWMDARVRVAESAKNAEAVAKMAELNRTRFLPSLAKGREETLAWMKAGELTVPTLVVWGKNDPSAPLEGGLELFDIICGSTRCAAMHIFNQAGHYSFREHPAAFVEVVSSFISGIPK